MQAQLKLLQRYELKQCAMKSEHNFLKKGFFSEFEKKFCNVIFHLII